MSRAPPSRDSQCQAGGNCVNITWDKVATCGRMATHEWNFGVAALDEGDAST